MGACYEPSVARLSNILYIMRHDDWELQVTADWEPLKEYNIEGRTVVMA